MDAPGQVKRQAPSAWTLPLSSSFITRTSDIHACDGVFHQTTTRPALPSCAKKTRTPLDLAMLINQHVAEESDAPLTSGHRRPALHSTTCHLQRQDDPDTLQAIAARVSVKLEEGDFSLSGLLRGLGRRSKHCHHCCLEVETPNCLSGHRLPTTTQGSGCPESSLGGE